jgi:hypothetical protein
LKRSRRSRAGFAAAGHVLGVVVRENILGHIALLAVFGAHRHQDMARENPGLQACRFG